MTKDPKERDLFLDLFGWDVSFEEWEKLLHTVRSDILTKPVRAFAFNLKNVDNLLLSPFLIAADGVQHFYWALKYIGGP